MKKEYTKYEYYITYATSHGLGIEFKSVVKTLDGPLNNERAISDLSKSLRTYEAATVIDWKLLNKKTAEEWDAAAGERELDGFRSAIEPLVNKDETFLPAGADQASIVLEYIIKMAKTSLYIYSESLDNIIFNDVCADILQERISEGELDIKVMTTSNSGDKSKFFNILDDEDIPCVSVCGGIASFITHNMLSRKNPENPEDKTYGNNFVVADGSAYRVETNAMEYWARCNFNDPSLGEQIATVFEHFYDNPEKLTRLEKKLETEKLSTKILNIMMGIKLK